MRTSLPNPTDHTVIILKGEHLGSEGFCLGAAKGADLYSVTPEGSNRVLQLRYGVEFALLINPGQGPDKN